MTLARVEWTGGQGGSTTLPGRRAHLSDSARRRLYETLAKRTVKEYERQWRQYLLWCHLHDVVPLPTQTDMLTNWVAERCDAGHSVSAIKQGIAAVVFHNDKVYGVPEQLMPLRGDAWDVLGAYHRELVEAGWRPDEAATYTPEQLRQMVASMDDGSALFVRDAAGLILATAGCARRSQIVGLNITDVTFTANGKVSIYIAKSKEDQRAKGRHQVNGPGGDRLSDPVGAVRRWVDLLASRNIRSGPLFRRLVKTSFGHRILDYRLDGRWLGRVVQDTVRDAGIVAPSGRTYRAHSTRASGATMAFDKGRPAVLIARHGGWSEKGLQVHSYNRPENQDGVMDGVM